MIISVEKIIDYMNCPVKYLFKHEVEHGVQCINIEEKYNIDIHKVWYNMYLRLQDKDNVLLTHLKKAWGGLWLQNRTGYDIVFAQPRSWRDRENTRRKDGINAVIKMYDVFRKAPGFPIAINQEYKIDIGKGIILSGVWEVIREIESNSKKLIEILDIRVDDKFHSIFYIDNDITLTAASYAFRKLTGEVEDRLTIYKSSKGVLKTTTRNENDYALLEYTVQQICKAINDKMFYARVGNHCYFCPYRHACKEGKNFENLMKGVVNNEIGDSGNGSNS